MRFPWLVAALLASATLGATTSAEPVARVSVQVLDDAGAPVPAARVFLTGLTEPVHRVLEADAEGQASFDNLPAGDFTLAAEKDGFVRGTFGSVSDSTPVRIALSQDTRFTGRIVIQRFGAIEGLVSDEKGEPSTADVRVLRYTGSPGAGRVQVVASSRSSGDGAFRFQSVVPGDYFVCARATRTPDATLIAVPACFGGSLEPSRGAPVRVAPAGVTGNVSLYLKSDAGARLHGTVINPNGQPAASTQIHVVAAIDDGFGMTTLRADSSGEFSATLLPGSYSLVVSGAGAIEVTLSPGTTSEVLFPLGRGANVSGKFAFAGGGVKPALPAGMTLFELVPAVSAYAQLASTIPVRSTDADSMTFGAGGIPSGRYQIRLGATLSGWVPESAWAGDRNLLTEGFHFFGAEQLADISLVMTRADAEVTGRIIDSSDAPVFDRKLLIFPADRNYWPSGFGRVRWAQPDTNGSFEISGLPAGRFLMALIADATDELTAAVLQEAAEGALAITLQPGQRLVQVVRTTER